MEKPKPASPFRRLPGVETPVGQALQVLSDMWDATPEAEGDRAPSEYRASQMNLILHFGREASAEQAAKTFQDVLRFSNRYPCRIVALCPEDEAESAAGPMDCKIYSECYIGPSRSGMSCCDAIILGYPLRSRQYLENQVSVFLEADLPTYYWPCRFGSAAPMTDYRFFCKEASRIVVDSAVDAELFAAFETEGIGKAHDLAYSRLLPLRQCLGQFASASPPAQLVEGLAAATVTCGSSIEAEGRALLKWIESPVRQCLAAAERQDSPPDFRLDAREDVNGYLAVEFEYENENRFRCRIDLEAGEAKLEANVGSGEHAMSAAVYFLDTERALAEALFFD